MAGNPLLSGTPAIPLVGVAQNPGQTQNPDMTVAPNSQGRHGQLHTANVHGQWYAAASRGNLYIATTLVAGVTVPVPATTLASKAGLVNPVGSGVNMELVALGISSVTIEVAQKHFYMEFQVKASTTGGSPTSVTKLTAQPLPLSSGSGTPMGYAYSAATMTNAAANPIIMPIFGDYLTAVGFVPAYFSFNGEVVMGPDTVMCITNTAALAAVNMTYIWAEWPV